MEGRREWQQIGKELETLNRCAHYALFTVYVIHAFVYIYIAHGSGAHSRSLAWSSGGLRGTDVPLPGHLPGPALVGPLQGPLRVLGPPEVINVLSSRKFPEEFPKTSAAVGSGIVDDHD